MKKIEAIIKPEKLDEVKNALTDHNIKGITITQVIGAGNQKGQKQLYRGAEVPINLLPKIKLEIVVAEDHVDEIVQVIAKTANTGNIGDGKIFVYTVDNAYRVRTGESGDAAL
ncbi:P-II family nitrogen regulator [Oscillospiraceae bacterium WX1]